MNLDAFVQQSQSVERGAGGLGLGLAIVRSLVAAHGGTVRANSEGVNRGSDFIVELPAVEVVADGAEDGRSVRPDRVVSAPRKILVVDDNEDAARMMRDALEQFGYDVEVAFDGPSALVRARSFRPETVVLDIGLPVMDGYEVARKLRSMEGGQQIRLLAVTGYGQATDRRRALEAGFEYHLAEARRSRSSWAMIWRTASNALATARRVSPVMGFIPRRCKLTGVYHNLLRRWAEL